MATAKNDQEPTLNDRIRAAITDLTKRPAQPHAPAP